jgi:hypothetical protein
MRSADREFIFTHRKVFQLAHSLPRSTGRYAELRLAFVRHKKRHHVSQKERGEHGEIHNLTNLTAKIVLTSNSHSVNVCA